VIDSPILSYLFFLAVLSYLSFPGCPSWLSFPGCPDLTVLFLLSFLDWRGHNVLLTLSQMSWYRLKILSLAFLSLLGYPVPGSPVPGCPVPGCRVPGCLVPGCLVPGCLVPGCLVPGCPALAVPSLAVLLRLSLYGCHCMAVIVWISFPGCPFHAGLSDCPILAVLVWLSLYSCPCMAVLLWLSFPGCVLAVLFLLSCPCCPVLAVLSLLSCPCQPFRLSFSGCPFQAVFPLAVLSCQFTVSWLSCPSRRCRVSTQK
jgi:hypothetical protein